MILHTHVIEEDDEKVGVYVIHASPDEARALAEALINAIDSNPESESFAITLGRVQDLDVPEEITTTAPSPSSGLILPGQ